MPTPSAAVTRSSIHSPTSPGASGASSSGIRTAWWSTSSDTPTESRRQGTAGRARGAQCLPTAEQEQPVGLVADQPQGGVVGGRRLLLPTQAAQEVGADRMEQVVPGEIEVVE